MNKKIITLIVCVLAILGIGVVAFYMNNNKQSENQSINDTLTENNKTDQIEQISKTDSDRTLILYFSRSGNTETIANYIHEEIEGNLVKLETKVAYPTDYDAVLDIAQKEKEENARPELATEINIDDYDVIFVGYPIWCYTLPMSIYSFFDSYDFTGKTIIPFTTHGTSGECGTFKLIQEYVPNANVLKGYNTYGNRANEAKSDVSNWLKDLGFNRITNQTSNSISEETQIEIEIGDKTVYGTLDNTELANEIKEMMPLTVSMGRFGNREFYGGIQTRPSSTEDGKLNFEDGDITYCPTNNTLAIFYNQSDRPNLTMEVIKIGKVTSDLSIFDEIDAQVEMVFKNNTETSNIGKTLIVYYSLTNRTERVAETLREKTGGDLYRIETVRIYPDEVMEVSAEARKERETKNYPELKGTLPNIDDYDFIIVGGPVWGSTTATPLKSFLEQVDFKGKKVAPYWTDDGMPGHYESDFGNEAQNAEVLDGMGLTDVKDMSDEDIVQEVETWLNKIR